MQKKISYFGCAIINGFNQNIVITSITNAKKLEIQSRFLESDEQTLTPLTYPAINLFHHPLLSHSFTHPHKVPHKHTFIAHFLHSKYMCKHRMAIPFFYIISVKWVISLLLPIYIVFLYMNWLQAQMFQFHTTQVFK